MTLLRTAACAVLAAAFGLTFALDPWQGELVSDIPLYRSYAELFLDGVVPYRDLEFEYPPLAAPLIALPGLVSLELADYRLAFAAICLVLAAGVLLATGRLAATAGGSEPRALAAMALAPLATGAMLRTHFDLAPILCLVCGLVAVGSGRSRTGFALFGVGGALKLFPLVAVPVAAAWLAGRGRRDDALTGVAIAAAVTVLAAGAAIAISPQGAWDAVDYHLERPVQIESMPATVLDVFDQLGGRPPEPVNSHRSDGLEHPATGALTGLFAALMLAAIAGLALAARRLNDVRGLVLTALGATAAAVSLGKVVSPQFMLWLLPLAAVAWAWRMRALATVTAAAVAATMLWFPERYFDLVAREDRQLASVAFRNALLVAMLVLIAREVARLLRESRGAARSTPPARQGGLRSARR